MKLGAQWIRNGAYVGAGWALGLLSVDAVDPMRALLAVACFCFVAVMAETL